MNRRKFLKVLGAVAATAAVPFGFLMRKKDPEMFITIAIDPAREGLSYTGWREIDQDGKVIRILRMGEPQFFSVSFVADPIDDRCGISEEDAKKLRAKFYPVSIPKTEVHRWAMNSA